MAGSQRLRFTLLQWQGVVAFLAVCLAAIALEASGEYGYLMALSYAESLAGVAVLIYYARLSPWMWIAVAGTAGSFIMRTLNVLGVSRYFISPSVSFTLLIYLGLAMTFRDVRQRLESCEDAPGQEERMTEMPGRDEVARSDDSPTL